MDGSRARSSRVPGTAGPPGSASSRSFWSATPRPEPPSRSSGCEPPTAHEPRLRARRPGRAEPALRPAPPSPTAPPSSLLSARTSAAPGSSSTPAGRPPRPGRGPAATDVPAVRRHAGHFDTIGPAGRRMMRCTASTQVCLDWWPGAAGIEQWRVLNLAGPLPGCGFARISGLDARLATWFAADPARTGFDDRLLRGTIRSRRTPNSREPPKSVHRRAGRPPHDLVPASPTARPYLEVRFLDVQPDGGRPGGGDPRQPYVRRRSPPPGPCDSSSPSEPALPSHWHAAAMGELIVYRNWSRSA